MLINVTVYANPLAPFGALRLVRFEPDAALGQNPRVRWNVLDHARTMGWTEVARYVFAPTCAMFGDDAAGEPYDLASADWIV